MRRWAACGGLLLPLATAVIGQEPSAAGSTTYKCPGNVYTNTISAQEAAARGCTAVEGVPITVIQSPRPRAASAPAQPAATPAPRPSEAKVDPAAQRQRDTDSRRILTEELRREEERLAALKREYNNGEPERLGSERNYQTYLDRVAAMKASIARAESDIAAIKRELAKLGP